jgi:ABC-type glycerol-3-phosphate transport system permease component
MGANVSISTRKTATTGVSTRSLNQIGLGVLTLVTAIAVGYPVYWMVIASLQTSGTAQIDQAWLFPAHPSLRAYVEVFTQRQMAMWIANTLLVTGVSTVLAMGVALLGAYAIARFRFPGRNSVLFFLLLTQLVPASSLIIPLFLTFRGYGLYDSLPAIAVAYVSFTVPEAQWVLWGYLQNLSEDFENAAMVDGCTRFGAFWRITLPLTLPGVAAAALFCFLEGWNQYLLAYVLTSSSANWVVSLGLFSFVGEYITNVEQMMAASVVASIPSVLLFVILQRYLKGGLTVGGLTG